MNDSTSTVINIHNLYIAGTDSPDDIQEHLDLDRIRELEQALWEALGCWKFDGVTDQHECIYATSKRVLGREAD